MPKGLKGAKELCTFSPFEFDVLRGFIKSCGCDRNDSSGNEISLDMISLFFIFLHFFAAPLVPAFKAVDNRENPGISAFQFHVKIIHAVQCAGRPGGSVGNLGTF